MGFTALTHFIGTLLGGLEPRLKGVIKLVHWYTADIDCYNICEWDGMADMECLLRMRGAWLLLGAVFEWRRVWVTGGSAFEWETHGQQRSTVCELRGV